MMPAALYDVSVVRACVSPKHKNLSYRLYDNKMEVQVRVMERRISGLLPCV